MSSTSDPRPAGPAEPGGPADATAADQSQEVEEALRRALRDIARRVEPPPWPGVPVRRRRRLHRFAVAVPLAAAAAVAAVLLLPPGRPAPATVVPAAGAGTPTHPTASAAPPVLPATPGRRIGIGHGDWLQLTADQLCFGLGGSPQCTPAGPGNQPSGTVDYRTAGDSTGTLYLPLYIGPDKPVRMTLRTGGVSYPVRLVALPGSPGYATGYVWTPPQPNGVFQHATVTAYDARGGVVAAFSG